MGVFGSDSTVQVGEHWFTVGGWDESRVGRPNSSGAQAQENRNKENRVEFRERRIVLWKVELDGYLVLLFGQFLTSSHISCSLLLVQTNIAYAM